VAQRKMIDALRRRRSTADLKKAITDLSTQAGDKLKSFIIDLRNNRDLFRSEDDPPAAKPATPLLSLRWTFRAKRACVVITDAKPDRLAPLTPPAPMGLRGVWVVAARCCASPPARCCADALERSFACPSANLRAPSRRGLHPRWLWNRENCIASGNKASRLSLNN
jgi:hypothetical protein